MYVCIYVIHKHIKYEVKMAKVITVSTPKGGVGKTTLAYYLATMYQEKGKTLIIDTDSQGNITKCLLGNENPLEDHNNFVSLFRKKNITPLPLNENLYLIGSNIDLAEYDSKNELNYFFILSKYLKKESSKYDYIIIDTPPNLGMFTLNALLATEYVVAPLDPSEDALDGIGVLVKTVNEMKEDHNEKIKLIGLVLNAIDLRNNADQKIFDKTKDKYNSLLFKDSIPRTTRIRDARASYKSILDTQPEHKVSIALLNIFKELNERMGA